MLINFCLATLALLLAVPIFVFSAQCLAALIPTRKPLKASAIKRPTVAILVPAHNEEAVIRNTLLSLSKQIQKEDRLIIVADNCTDKTAKIASEFNTEVIEREDQAKRGKGYALDAGLKALTSNPPEIVIVVDADCTLEDGALEKLARKSFEMDRPIQGAYVIERPTKPSPRDTLSAFAVLVKNIVRPLGMSRMGFPSPLTGSGMAFPWKVIQKVSLATGNIVEDMQLGLDLAYLDKAPLFCGEAKVLAKLPCTHEAAIEQRKRWEHGHLDAIFRQVPLLIEKGIQKRKIGLIVLGLDLCIPPLALLAVIWGLIFMVSNVLWLLGFSGFAAGVVGVSGVIFLAAVSLTWYRFAKEDFPLRSFLALPGYILQKTPIYKMFVFEKQKEWVKTQRDTK